MGKLYLTQCYFIRILLPTSRFHLVAMFTAMAKIFEKRNVWHNRMETGSRRDAGSTFAVVIVANSDMETSL